MPRLLRSLSSLSRLAEGDAMRMLSGWCRLCWKVLMASGIEKRCQLSELVKGRLRHTGNSRDVRPGWLRLCS